MAISTAQWKHAVQPLLGDGQGWAFRGKLAYRVPVGWLLLGVHANGSGFSRDHVYVQSLYMPLFVPFPYLVLSYGRRVPSGSTPVTVAELPTIVAQALRDVPAEREGLERIAGVHRSEEGCYALLLLGRTKEAQDALAMPYAAGDDRPFVQEKRVRMAEILSILTGDGVEAAVGQLHRWRDETVASVRVA